MITIRDFNASDWSAVWDILQPIFRAGDTYAFDMDITESDAVKTWIELPKATYVATDETGLVVGTYYIKPNFQGPGSHVCNCGYAVSEQTKGLGIASAMCRHSLQEAVSLGFRSMQFNSVVSTNRVAIHIWKKFGFQVIGVLPDAFKHPGFGYVDALVMYKQLVD